MQLFVIKTSVKRLSPRLPPTLLRPLSDSEEICIFADVKKCPRGWGQSAA